MGRCIIKKMLLLKASNSAFCEQDHGQYISGVPGISFANEHTSVQGNSIAVAVLSGSYSFVMKDEN